MNFDVIIIGGGAGGMSAALWCAELGLRALLLESKAELGGQLLRVYNEIKNHLGCEAADGRELRDIFVRQIERRDFAVRLEANVAQADLKKKTVRLENGETFSAEFIVVATGVERRKLNVAGEEKFRNKGIIASGKRDQNSVKNKSAAIVGGGDAAFENALILADAAAKVYLVHRHANFRAREEFVREVLKNPKIEILTERIVAGFAGDEQIRTVELKNLRTKETETLSVEAVLIRIGVEPATDIFRGQIDLDEKGYIETNSFGEASVSGVFAVGDVANPASPTVSSAVGAGATAAKAIFADRASEMLN